MVAFNRNETEYSDPGQQRFWKDASVQKEEEKRCVNKNKIII